MLSNMLHAAEYDMAKPVKASDIDVFLSDAAWAVCFTHHTVLKASPGAAIFGQDMLFDIPFIADWKKIGEQRHWLTDRDTARENEGRIDYDYKVGQKNTCMEQQYTPQSKIQVSQRPLDNHDSPYK